MSTQRKISSTQIFITGLFLLLFLFGNQYSQIQNFRVSNEFANYPEEVSIAVNPLNPNCIAVGSNLDYIYYSLDGGQTWTQNKMSSSHGVWGDPCLIYDGLGNLYFGHLSNPNEGYWIDRIVVQKSTDFGVSWSDGVGVGFNPPTRVQDKEWLGVDLTSSQYRNNLYMSWTQFDQYGSSAPTDSSIIRFSRSTNQGETWSDAVRVSDLGGDCIDSDNTVEGAVPCVGPNGEVYLSWSGPLGIMFDKSLNGGQTFGKDIFVTQLYAGWDLTIPGINRCNGMPVTCCDISSSPFRGTIYINWSDQKNSSSDTDIFLAKSTDGGNTWSTPIKVNNDESGRHQFFTWMSVDPSNGYIYLVCYDRRNTQNNTTEVYLARSKDGGDTFENFKISETPFQPVREVFFGDYITVVALNGKIFPVWTRMDNNILSIWSDVLEDSDLIVSIDENSEAVEKFYLGQNYPNPFNPSTNINFYISDDSFVTLKVYDVLGEEIASLVNDNLKKGNHEIKYDISRNENIKASTILFYRLKTENYSSTKKMVYLK
ncbi:MAG: T9SS type A sorting domain-containing protein [bacterium]